MDATKVYATLEEFVVNELKQLKGNGDENK